MNSTDSSNKYYERLWPSLGLFIALLLIIPALMVLMLPFQVKGSIFIGIGVYLAVAFLFLVASPKVEITRERLTAGRGSIETKHLGRAIAYDKVGFRQAIGRRLDARAYLLLNGWVKTGVQVEITDMNDPTPYWIISSRNPEKMRDFINSLSLKE